MKYKMNQPDDSEEVAGLAVLILWGYPGLLPIGVFLDVSARVLAGLRLRRLEIDPLLLPLPGRWSCFPIAGLPTHFPKNHCSEFAFCALKYYN